MIGVLLAASVACSPISRTEAVQLVLLTPAAIASRDKRGAVLAARFSQSDRRQWVFRVYATNTTSPSNLIGWFEVDPYNYVVRDWIREDKPIQVSSELRAAQKRLRRSHCLG